MSEAKSSGKNSFDPRGVIPAVLLPFDSGLQIDEPALRKHLVDVTSVSGVSAIAVNGHSTEVLSCTLEERQRVLDVALDEIGDRTPVVSGVYAESTREAMQIASAADRSGASALLVFAPALFAGGAVHRPRMTLEFYRAIASVTDLPLILFQFPMAGGLGTHPETLLQLAEEVPTFCAIKDFCNSPVQAEVQVRALRSLSRPIRVLSSHSSWLLGSLAIGCDGILSGMGSVTPALHVALFEAMERGDLTTARQVADRLFPLTQVLYADPFGDMHNRMKEALVLLGLWKEAHVRGPLLKLDVAQIERISAALAQAGLQRTPQARREQTAARA